ncbi:unnamed protein product [Blepharisma stoltei]|uniref:tRNA (adenine(58)-N(1))-methyltransferase non-catalytic subunit TRM6 n=1 Tax=Blepharisma stoltei TaxID=1481888 RepID=A0AAU9JVI0_9CILI|nr:unnamed protein product [Blepharisma stoltei]
MSWVVLQVMSGPRSLVQLRGKVKVGKQFVKLSPELLYNRVYQVKNGEPELASGEDTYDGPVTGDNRGFIDDNTAQTLTSEEIIEIRNSEGGEALINTLVQNSKTFNMKTQFSQEKYLRKKKNKHLALFKILRATPGNIADTQYSQKPSKSIRSDALHNLLALGNIHSDCAVLVYDDIGGILLGSVLEKTTGTVSVVRHAHYRDHNLKYFGIKVNSERISHVLPENPAGTYDSLIVASQEPLKEILEKYLPLLRPSGTISTYSQDLMQVAIVYEWLIKETLAVNVCLEEIWTREFQVLPERTHPNMNSRQGSSGGYIVSGNKVISEIS